MLKKSYHHFEVRQLIKEAVKKAVFCPGRPTRIHDWQFTGLNHRVAHNMILGEYKCSQCSQTEWFIN